MNGENGMAQRKDDSPSIRFSGRSFVLANGLPRVEQRALEVEIEARGGSVHPFLNAVTDVLVVGRAEGNQSGAQWAREQIRRGEIYRARWGHLEFVTEEELRGALEVGQGRTA
jgi:NAD-dependent DNA ligase